MSIDIGAEVEINLTEETGKSARRTSERQKLAQQVYQAPIIGQVPLVTGAGVLDEPAQYGPPRGFMWCIRRLTLWGYTAGSIIPSIDQLEPILLSNANAAQTVFIGKAEWMLDSGQRIVFTATGITGSAIINGVADCFPRALLPVYLSIGELDES